jgi:hypothetical protein
VHPGLHGRLSLVRKRGLEGRAPAVRIRRRYNTGANFDHNRFHLTPSRTLNRRFKDNRAAAARLVIRRRGSKVREHE